MTKIGPRISHKVSYVQIEHCASCDEKLPGATLKIGLNFSKFHLLSKQR